MVLAAVIEHRLPALVVPLHRAMSP